MAGLLILLNLIPHVTVRSYGWLSLRGISIEVNNTTVHVEKVSLWLNIWRSQLEPYRMIHVGLFNVSVHQREDPNGEDQDKDSLPPSIPENLVFRIPSWAYNWLLKSQWMNQFDIHVFRCSLHHDAVSADLSAHFDYIRVHNRYDDKTSDYRFSLSIMDGYLLNLRSKLSPNENLIKIFKNVVVAVGSSFIFSCCSKERGKMIVELSDFFLLVSISNPYVTPITGLTPAKPKKQPKQTYDTSDSIPMLNQFVKAFAIASSVELRVENLKAEYENITVDVSSMLVSLRREKSYKLNTMAEASTYVNSLRLYSSETKCVDIPSLTYLFECDMSDLFRAYEEGNTANFHVDINTSLDLTHPSFDIYFDQIEDLMAMLKLSSSKSKHTAEQEQKPFLAVPLSKYLRKMRKTSVKLGISDTRVSLHLPAMNLTEFVRSSVNNVTATANISYFLTKYSSKELGKILMLNLRPEDPPSSLKAFAKLKNLVVDIEENQLIATKLNVMAAYCLNTHRVKIKVFSKRLVTRSVNDMIFYVVRRLRDSHIKHYNDMLQDMMESETTTDPDASEHECEDEPEVEYVDFVDLLPECITLASFRATELHGTIICKDGLPSHKVEGDEPDQELDMADFRRGVSVVITGYYLDFDRSDQDFYSGAKKTEVFVLSEYAAKVLHTNISDEQNDLGNEVEFSDLLSIESFGDDRLGGEDFSPKQRQVLDIKNIKVRTEPETTDKLILTIPEADGKADMFLIWCIFYAKSLLKQFQPTVKVEYTKDDLRRLKGTQKRIKLDVHVESAAIKVLLPNDTDTLLEIETLAVTDASNSPSFDLKNLRLYVVHPATEAWSRLVSIHRTQSSLGELLQETCSVKSASIKIYVPFRYLLYKVIDNVITMVKATKQIKFNFDKLSNGDHDFERIMPEAKPAILFPKIRWYADKFNLSLEEDIFETELGLIYQLGRVERVLREKKWLKFEEEAKKIREKVHSSSVELDEDAVLDKSRFIGDSKGNKHPPRHFKSHFASTLRHGFKHLDKNSRTNSDYLKTETADNSESGDTEFSKEEAEAQIEEARQKVMEEISASWITNFNRIKRAKYAKARRIKTKVAGYDRINPMMGKKYNIQKLAPGSPIMSVAFTNFDLTLNKADIDDVDEFLRVYGKGQPKLDYSILVPLYIRLKAASFHVSLKDYPLPMINFPPSEKPGATIMDLLGNLVINEKLVHRKEEMRHIYVPFTAATLKEKSVENFYSVHVPRTLTPVKAMFDISCSVDTERACIINWSKSYLAAILSAAGALDNFTKPQIDDSPIGFWDKLALIMHGKLRFDIPNELCLQIKSSSDPYGVIGKSAGYMWSWKHGVELMFNYTGDQKEFIILDSYDFVFGVPDCSYAHGLAWGSGDEMEEQNEDLDDNTTFQKKVMKFSSDEKVRWTLGVLFERNEDPKCREVSADHKRTDEFRPHYDVFVTSPDFDWHPDSYEGFRSDYLHLALGVKSVSKKGNSHNTAYLTPVAFAYFFYWFLSMSDVVSMPVRQGKLFNQTAPETSVKMSLHLVTFKYQLILEPLTVSHMYTTYENLEDGPRVVVTGLKGKSDKCHIDLHSRKEVVRYVNEKLGIDKKVHTMKLHLGEVTVTNADIRAIKATFKDPSVRGHIIAYYTNQLEEPLDVEKYHEELAKRMRTLRSSSWTRTIQCDPEDFGWLDQDDFVELESREELSPDPTIVVVPFFHTPRFTYFREFTLEREPHKYPFGHEPSHTCYIGGESPDKVQADLLKQRASVLKNEIKGHQEELKKMQKAGETNPVDRERLEKEIAEGEHRMVVVHDIFQDCADSAGDDLFDQEKEELGEEAEEKEEDRNEENEEAEDDVEEFPGKEEEEERNGEAEPEDFFVDPSEMLRRKSNTQSLYSGFKSMDQAQEITAEDSELSQFHNRFLFHNVRLKWNNKVRNLVTGYMFLIGARRTETLMMSKKAVDLIENIAEQNREKDNESKKSVNPEDEAFKLTFQNSGDVIQDFEEYLNELSSDQHEMEYKFLIKFIRPQIQLESEIDPNSSMAVTSQDIEMRILSENIAGTDDVMKDSNSDEVNAVESRHGVLFRDMQAFVFHKDNFTEEYDSPYGDLSKKKAWPPWVDYEACMNSTWLKDDLVVERTSMALIVKKPNFLSMEYNTNLHADELTVHLAKVVVNATSEQYSSVYYILLNLLLDSKSAKEQLHQRLDQIIELSGLEETDGLADRVKLLQNNIHVCQTILLSLTDHKLSKEEVKGKAHVEMEMDKMFVQLAIITHSLRSASSQNKGNGGVGKYWNIYADQVIWHLFEKPNKPLVDFALAPSKFQRVDMVDGSNTNRVEISMMQGFNLRQNAFYPDMMLPLVDHPSYKKNSPVIEMTWKMLSRVGGIRIMKNARLKCQLASVQLDFDTAQLLLDYLFPLDQKHAEHGKPGTSNGKEEQNSDESTREGSDDVSEDKAESEVELDDEESSSSGKSRSMSSSINPFRKMIARRTGNGTPTSSTPSSPKSPKSSKSPTRSSMEDTSSVDSSSRLSSSDLPSLNSDTRRALGMKKKTDQKDETADDLSIIMQRSSKFFVIDEIELEPIKLRISFKAPKHLNIIDVHKLLLSIPKLHYEYKTWSGEDFVLQLKKEVIRIILSHTGKIIGNKFKHRDRKVNRRPLKQIRDFTKYVSIEELQEEEGENGLTEQPSIRSNSTTRLSAIVSEQSRKSSPSRSKSPQ